MASELLGRTTQRWAHGRVLVRCPHFLQVIIVLRLLLLLLLHCQCHSSCRTTSTHGGWGRCWGGGGGGVGASRNSGAVYVECKWNLSDSSSVSWKVWWRGRATGTRSDVVDHHSLYPEWHVAWRFGGWAISAASRNAATGSGSCAATSRTMIERLQSKKR